MTRSGLFEGWRLLGLVSGLLVAMALAILAWDSGEDGIRLVIRITARTSLLLFLLAITASALRRLWPNSWSCWQLRNRRYLGLGFAVSHGIHALAVIAFARLDPAGFQEATSIASYVLGGTAYVFITLMAATSFDRTAAWIGPVAWRRLHTIGVIDIWATFMASNLRRVGHDWHYWIPVALLLIAMTLRLVGGLSLRQAPARSAP